MKEQLWNTFLQLNQKIRQSNQAILFCYLQFGAKNQVAINEIIAPSDGCKLIKIVIKQMTTDISDIAVVQLTNEFTIDILSKGDLTEEAINFIQLYLPYIFIPYIAKKQKRSIAIAHFAQSLDGKIATSCGNSYWIGNEGNLIHAHRMRALCDAVLIGKNTLKSDLPKLTVRKVEGTNPRRVVVGNSKGDYTSLLESCTEPILVLTSEKQKNNGVAVEYLQIETEEERISGKAILNTLFQQDIYSVYIEGGAITTSNFLKDEAVDILQLHISPYVFGSGRQGIVLPEITDVQEAIKFKKFSFRPIGDSMMFEGILNKLDIC